MPGRQSVTYGGYQFVVGPAFWLRRWTRFPFYFESHNPSFRITLKHIADEHIPDEWQSGRIAFRIQFADNTMIIQQFDFPDLTVGESKVFTSKEIFTSSPGQTKILLPIGVFHDGLEGLFSYNVHREEAMWVPLATIIVAAASALLTIGGQRLLEWIGG